MKDINFNIETVWGGKKFGTNKVTTVIKDIVHEFGVTDRYGETIIRGSSLKDAMRFNKRTDLDSDFFAQNYRGYKVVEREWDFFIQYFVDDNIFSIRVNATKSDLIEALKIKVAMNDLYFVSDSKGNEITSNEIYSSK